MGSICATRREDGQATALINCGAIVSGRLDDTILNADSIVMEDGRISRIGRFDEIEVSKNTLVIDVSGQDVIPGLIDTHIHPGFGDWSARTRSYGWMQGYVGAGVTTALSQGSFFLDPYPSEGDAMAVLGESLADAFRYYRPGGMKVHAGCVSLVEGLNEAHLAMLSKRGVRLIAEIGVKSIVEATRVRDLLTIAHELGFTSRVHFGPESIDDTVAICAEQAMQMGAHIASHVNGGPTSPPTSEIDTLIHDSEYWLEVNTNGNSVSMLHTVAEAREASQLHRLMVGSDTPTGAGIPYRSIIRSISDIANGAGLEVAEAVALCTGNAARAYSLNTGILEEGREADLIVLDAPRGSQADSGLEALQSGDVPAITLTLIDGEVISCQAENTMPGKRRCRITGESG